MDDLKMISIDKLSNTKLHSIKNNIEIIIRKDEEIIEKYLERYVYTSILSKDIKDKLDTIFKIVSEDILDGI